MTSIENSYSFFLSHVMFYSFYVIFLLHISGKTHTLMAPDGITAGVIERCFKRITQDERHDYKVQLNNTDCLSWPFQRATSFPWMVYYRGSPPSPFPPLPPPNSFNSPVSCCVTEWKETESKLSCTIWKNITQCPRLWLALSEPGPLVDLQFMALTLSQLTAPPTGVWRIGIT